MALCAVGDPRQRANPVSRQRLQSVFTGSFEQLLSILQLRGHICLQHAFVNDIEVEEHVQVFHGRRPLALQLLSLLRVKHLD